MPSGHPCLEVFVRCADAVRANKLIRRESRQDTGGASSTPSGVILPSPTVTHIQCSTWLFVTVTSSTPTTLRSQKQKREGLWQLRRLSEGEPKTICCSNSVQSLSWRRAQQNAHPAR